MAKLDYVPARLGLFALVTVTVSLLGPGFQAYDIGTCYGQRSCLGDPTSTVSGNGNDQVAISGNCDTFMVADYGGKIW